MNKKVLIEKYQANVSTDDIIKYCKKNHGKATEYDLSWRGISRFGFQLKGLGKVEEALQIFHTSITERSVSLFPMEHVPLDAFQMFHLYFLHEPRDLKKLKIV